MVIWMWNVSLTDMIAAEEPSTILRLKSRRKCFDDKRLQWFDHLEKKWKRVLGLVNAEPFKIVVVYPWYNLGKHGKR